MTVYASDSLADANGTLLTAHVPAIGGPWVADFLPSTATPPTIHTNALLIHQHEGNEQCLRLVPTTPQTDYRVLGTIKVQYAANGSLQGEVYVAGRMRTGGYNGYAFGWYRNGVFVLRKYRDVGLSQNYFTVASVAQPTLPDGTYIYELIFITNGSGHTEITVKVDGAIIVDRWVDTGAGYEALQPTGDAGVIAWNEVNYATIASSLIYLDKLEYDSVPAGAQKLALTRGVGGAVPGIAFTTQPKVALKDYYGVTQTGVADTITLAKVSGPGVLAGTLAQVVNVGTGEATWTNVSASAAGAYVLSATSPLFGTITFSITVLVPTALFSATMLGAALTDVGMVLLDGGAILEVRDGVKPANTAAAATGVVGARIVGGAYGTLNFSEGCSSFVPVAKVLGLANINPTWARLYKSDGVTVLADVTAGPGMVLDMNAASITVGLRVQLEYLTLIDASATVTVATQVRGLVALGGTMSGPAELPRTTVNSAMPVTTVTKTVGPVGRDYTDLQTAINAAAASGAAWKILIDAGYDYIPPGGQGLLLPPKAGTNWVVIMPATLTTPEGTRMTPARAAADNLPKIRLDNINCAINTTSLSAYYRLTGLEILPVAVSPPVTAYQMINFQPDNNTFGGQGTSYADTPHHFVVDRCYLHADGVVGVSNMIALNAPDIAVVQSHIDGNVSEVQETHGIGGYMSEGRWKIVDNYIEAIAENIILGGSESVWPGMVFGDVEILNNTLAKNPGWHGVNFYTKTLCEMKAGTRARIEGNELAYNWEGNKGWYGNSFTFKTVNQNGMILPWWRLSDITVRNNRIQYSGAMVNVFPLAEGRPGTACARIHFVNNLAAHVGDFPATGTRKWAVSLGQLPRASVTDLTVDHNTYAVPGLGGSAIMSSPRGLGYVRVFIKNNIFAVGGVNPVGGDDFGYVDENIAAYFGPSSDITRNVTSGFGYEPSGAPVGAVAVQNTWLVNAVDGTYADIGFTNLAGEDYSLSPSSPGHAYATDGTDAGVDMVALLAALAGGTPGGGGDPPPDPPPPGTRLRGRRIRI